MSEKPSQTQDLAADAARLRRELDEKTSLIQGIRRDLIQAQVTILELHDTILQKETDKADAVAILGQLEHVLEEKINYIYELDRVLNTRIAALQQELAAERTARAQEVGDLVQKLDTANREIGATHTMAGNYARDLAHTRDALQQAEQELVATRKAWEQTRRELEIAQTTLAATEKARAALAVEIAAMRATLSWRFTAPFRALRRLFR